MSTKIKDYPIPHPRKGWRWLVGERTQRGDHFLNGRGSKGISTDNDYYTAGPRVWHTEGNLRFEVSGYIRRIPKKRSRKP